jgi:phage tail-like protein
MAILRDRPYGCFNYRVSVGGNPIAGLCEVKLPAAQIQVTEFREGGDPANSPRLVLGTTRYSEVVLRRGLIGALDLWEWFRSARDGNADRRDVRIDLLSEDHAGVVMSWRLSNCVPVRYSGPALDGDGGVAFEELAIATERMEVE